MPAGSESPGGSPPVALPRRFRPLGVRLAASVVGALLLLVCVAFWLTLPGEIRAQFSTFQRLTILAIGAGVFACGFALARSRIDADPEGLTVVNGYKRRRLAWTQVLAVTMRPGSPWALLDLSDGTTVPAMAIQGSDGPRARGQVRQVRALVDHFSRTDEDR